MVISVGPQILKKHVFSAHSSASLMRGQSCAVSPKLDDLLLRTEFAANRDDFDIRKRTTAIFGKNGRCRDDGVDLLVTVSHCKGIQVCALLTSFRVANQSEPRICKVPPFIRQPSISHAPANMSNNILRYFREVTYPYRTQC
jgi:hypothetical protein